jgi:hypothetical protein
LPASRQKVTGIVVNKKTSPPKKLIRKTRQQLYYCEKFGLVNHCENQGITVNNFLREIQGMIGFMRMMAPDVALEFEGVLKKVTHFDPVQDQEELFMTLKHAVENELTVKFSYYSGRVQAAPIELYIDDDGRKYIRAFEFFPGKCWMRYYLPAIIDLEIIDLE